MLSLKDGCFSCRGVAQPGSAPALGAGGRAFKSPRPDHRINRLQADKSRTWVSGRSISLFESIESALCVKRCVRTLRQRRELSVFRSGSTVLHQRSRCDRRLWGTATGKTTLPVRVIGASCFKGAHSSWYVHQRRVDQSPLRRELQVYATDR